MPIDTEIIDKLLKDYKSPEDVLGENGLLKQCQQDFGIGSDVNLILLANCLKAG
jgi:hypothetical protein